MSNWSSNILHYYSPALNYWFFYTGNPTSCLWNPDIHPPSPFLRVMLFAWLIFDLNTLQFLAFTGEEMEQMSWPCCSLTILFHKVVSCLRSFAWLIVELLTWIHHDSWLLNCRRDEADELAMYSVAILFLKVGSCLVSFAWLIVELSVMIPLFSEGPTEADKSDCVTLFHLFISQGNVMSCIFACLIVVQFWLWCSNSVIN